VHCIYSLAEEAGITWLTGRGTRERERNTSSIFFDYPSYIVYAEYTRVEYIVYTGWRSGVGWVEERERVE
jgi:hypothetical protein